jgi:hypothetical protein
MNIDDLIMNVTHKSLSACLSRKPIGIQVRSGEYSLDLSQAMDLDDALWLFAVLGLNPTYYDLVCCDEA